MDWSIAQSYQAHFAQALAKLQNERRYRVFADLERHAGRFPRVTWHCPHGVCDVVIWCSNDYLGMDQHPKVGGAMIETATRMGTGAGGTRNIARTNHPLVELEIPVMLLRDIRHTQLLHYFVAWVDLLSLSGGYPPT